MAKTYKCDACGGVFEYAWTEEEAEAELAETFDVPKEECGIVCDDCYKRMGFGA